MRIRVFLLILLAVAGVCQGRLALAARSELISEAVAAQHGLTRAWFTQVEVDPASGRLEKLALHDGVLYSVTNKAVVHAMDAETGKTLWSQQVGKAAYPTLAPGVSREFVAVINGSTLYVLNRSNGDLLLETGLSGSPGAGPAVSTRHVFVPMVDGKLVAYRLNASMGPGSDVKATKSSEVGDEAGISEETKRKNLHLERGITPPLFCQSYGQILVQPVMGRETPIEENVVWPTDRGYLNLACINQETQNRLAMKYRLQTGAPIVAKPAYYPADPEVGGDSGLIVTASRDGFVYAFREKDGQSVWRFSIGEPIVDSPVTIEGRVYVCAELGGMYDLDIKTGKELWFTPNIAKFVAVGQKKVYVSDRTGRLLVLDAVGGNVIDAIATESAPMQMENDDTDRIYIADHAGMIQCLHEAELSEPIVHDKQRKQGAIVDEKRAIKQTGIDEEKGDKKEHAPAHGGAKANHKNAAADEANEGQEEHLKPKAEHPAGGTPPKKRNKAKKAEGEAKDPFAF